MPPSLSTAIVSGSQTNDEPPFRVFKFLTTKMFFSPDYPFFRGSVLSPAPPGYPTVCNNIPETHYKSLYYALFESHLSYCTTVFGNVCETHSQTLFTIQKHCMRILFGDKEAYLDKFKTYCRTIFGHSILYERTRQTTI